MPATVVRPQTPPTLSLPPLPRRGHPRPRRRHPSLHSPSTLPSYHPTAVLEATGWPGRWGARRGASVAGSMGSKERGVRCGAAAAEILVFVFSVTQSDLATTG